MNTSLVRVCTVIAVLCAVPAFAETFKIGDHVTYPAIGISGTIAQVGGPSGTVLIYRDGFPQRPEFGVWYDPARLQHSPAPAEAQGQQQAGPTPSAGGNKFRVGDHVSYPAIGISGTVTELGGPSGTVKVVRDDLPQVTGDWYDPAKLVSSAAPSGRPGQVGGIGGGNVGTAGGYAGGMSGGFPHGRGNIPHDVPSNSPPNESTFKALIRASQGEPANDETKTVEFQTFTVGGPVNHEAAYQGHLNSGTILGGAGHRYQAWPVHTRFTVVSHYDNPHAPDEVTIRENDYMMYKNIDGSWVADAQGTSRLISRRQVPRQ